MEKENFKPKEKPAQIIEGAMEKFGDFSGLPEGVNKDMVDIYLGNDGKYHWHLRPEYIADEKEKKNYSKERNDWEK